MVRRWTLSRRITTLCALAAIVPESVGKKLNKYFLEQLRINIQYPILKLHVPCDLVVFF